MPSTSQSQPSAAPTSGPRQREMVFCHECTDEWYRDERGIICPECGSDFTEIIEDDNDPRDNAFCGHEHADDEDSLFEEGPSTIPTYPLADHNPSRDDDPEHSDISSMRLSQSPMRDRPPSTDQDRPLPEVLSENRPLVPSEHDENSSKLMLDTNRGQASLSNAPSSVGSSFRALEGRDHVFIIDDSASMQRHWGDVAKVFRDLASTVAKTDPDGIELRFTSSSASRNEGWWRHEEVEKLITIVEKKTPKSQKDKIVASSNVTKQPHADFDLSAKTPQTNSQSHKLQLSDSSKIANANANKGQSLYFLTDGLWKNDIIQNYPKRDSIHEIISQYRQKWQQDLKLGIQFIRFGKGSVGDQNIRSLKADLEEMTQHIDRDIVGTKEDDDSAFKTLLGSIEQSGDDDKDLFIVDDTNYHSQSNKRPLTTPGAMAQEPEIKVSKTESSVSVEKLSSIDSSTSGGQGSVFTRSMSATSPDLTAASTTPTLQDLDTDEDDGAYMLSPSANEKSGRDKELLGGRFDDDIRSIISNEDAEALNSTASTTRIIRRGYEFENAVVTILAANSSLKPLFEKALQLMPEEMFVNNLRRLLGTFRDGLTNMPKDVVTQEVAALLTSKETRFRIAQRIVGKQALTEDQLSDDSLKRSEERDNSYLEGWLLKSDFSPPPPPPDMINDEKETGTDLTEYPTLDRVVQTLVQGQPFREMTLSLKKFLLPHGLYDDLLPIPRDMIKFQPNEEPSLVNDLQCWLENVTASVWEWWPLAPCKRPLTDGEIRVYWKCFCGSTRWCELNHSQKEILDEILQQPPSLSGRPLQCSRLRSRSMQAAAHSGSQTEMAHGPAHGFEMQDVAGAGSGRLSAPTGADPHPSEAPSNAPEIETTLYNSTSSEDADPDEHLWSIFGATRKRLGVDQISDAWMKSDPVFLRRLRRMHRHLRGWIRALFSIWQLHHWEFVKSKRLPVQSIKYSHHNDEQPSKTELNYKFNPRPPDTDAPGITKHEFETIVVQSCIEPCWLERIFPFWHECNALEDNGIDIVGSIPKRTRAIPFIAKLKEEEDKYVWGIEARYAISGLRVFLIHAFVIAGSIAFWIWWQISHPKDLQGAAVVVTVAATIISAFWGSSGVLRSLR